jgi:hypothetical protein
MGEFAGTFPRAHRSRESLPFDKIKGFAIPHFLPNNSLNNELIAIVPFIVLIVNLWLTFVHFLFSLSLCFALCFCRFRHSILFI